jgi:DNA-binding CsgD family transcriptional regulator
LRQGTSLVYVCEEIGPTGAVILGASIGAFVREDFVRDLKTPPHFWICAELVRRIRKGNSPILSDKEIREANSCVGLTSVVWQSAVRLDVPGGPERAHQSNLTFFGGMRGFRLNEVLAQMESVEHAENVAATGGLVFNPASGRHEKFPEPITADWVGRPHVAGLNRESAETQLGSWAASMFRYQPPRIGFTESQQRLLMAALQGGSNQELADQLGVSAFAVKRTWRAIYDRASDRIPELVADPAPDSRPGRGKEKKGHLLAYVNEHPEELRPVTRKFLRNTAIA